MNNEINSVFTVTEYRTGRQTEYIVEGYGQPAVKTLKKSIIKLSKIVLDGFEINGKFVPLDTKSKSYD